MFGARTCFKQLAMECRNLVIEMKIGNGQGPLLERMRQAHTERQDEVAKTSTSPGKAFRLQDASSTSVAVQSERSSVEKPEGLKASLLGIADHVISGRLKDVDVVRREVLAAIVEDEYASLVEPLNKRKAVDMLELTLANDPQFEYEVDRMLILAAQELVSS